LELQKERARRWGVAMAIALTCNSAAEGNVIGTSQRIRGLLGWRCMRAACHHKHALSGSILETKQQHKELHLA